MNLFLRFPRYCLLLILGLAANTGHAYDAHNSLSELLPDRQLPSWFVDTFGDLIDTHWDDSGDWSDDMQNDATAFAPSLLFAIDDAIGEGPGEYYQRALQTGAWEKHLVRDAIRRFLRGQIDEAGIFDIAVGTYGVLACANLAAGSDAAACRAYMKPIINLANFAFLSPLFDWLGVFSGQEATLYARLAYLNIEYYKATGLATYRNAAIKLAARLEKRADPDQDGIFSGDVFGWSQASPLVTFAGLYGITGNTAYLEKADRMIAALDRDYLFGIPGEAEAYWEMVHNGLQSSDDAWVLASSTHVQFLEAFTLLATATGDPGYLERANRFLEFAVQYFYIPNHNPYQNDAHFSHDLSWTVGVTQPVAGDIAYNDEYCSGESFNFLRVAWTLLEYQRQ